MFSPTLLHKKLKAANTVTAGSTTHGTTIRMVCWLMPPFPLDTVEVGDVIGSDVGKMSGTSYVA